MDFAIERTGEFFSFASNQFRVTYPDGYVGHIWSPPWHEKTAEEEQADARAFAEQLFRDGKHREEKSGR